MLYIPSLVCFLLTFRLCRTATVHIRGPQETNATLASAYNGSLSDAPPVPWGPDEFTFNIDRTSTPMNILDCYMFIIELLSQLCQEDFDGQMPEDINRFQNPKYPHVVLSAAARGQGRKLPRRYVLWGIARIMNNLVQHKTPTFHGGVYGLKWGGRPVGRILLISIAVPTIANSVVDGFGLLDANQTNEESLSTLAKQTPYLVNPSLTDTSLTWTHDFHGEEMTQADVFMGAIGTLIQAAQLPSSYLDTNIGFFPSYKAVHVYNSLKAPSVLTKGIIIQTILNITAEARNRMDFHEQKTLISEAGVGEIVSGGYFRHPLTVQGLSPDVSVS